MKRIFSLILLFAFSLVQAETPGAEESKAVHLATLDSISPTQVASLDQPYVLLDVRSTMEWWQGHIMNARHLPHDEVHEKVTDVLPDRHLPIITYCGSGGRAMSVIETLRQQGYTAVAVSSGGYQQLLEAGLQED